MKLHEVQVYFGISSSTAKGTRTNTKDGSIELEHFTGIHGSTTKDSFDLEATVEDNQEDGEEEEDDDDHHSTSVRKPYLQHWYGHLH